MSGVRAKTFIKTRSKSDQIARHIVGCEFCAAEQSFLSAYSLTAEEYELAEMPAHLRRLAEGLLVGRLGGFYKGSIYGSGPSLSGQGFAFD